MSTNETPKVEPPPALPDIDATEEKTTEKGAKPVPNAKPRPAPLNPDDTYVYKDYASVPLEALDTDTCHKKVPPACLQAQKLPSKMAVMLVDPDLMHIISWLPHGRSWKIYNRDMFQEIALPRYFGHKNYASFVRIVNAWGFRRVTSGLDRDSYYHELFLRGKPELHQRMKRLPTTHRKTPVSKEDKAPDFYEMSKISPLPEVTISKPAPTLYNGSLHPMGSSYFPSAAAVGGAVAAVAAAASVGATATAAASVEATATAAQEENADTKDKKQDDATAMLEQNMRLSNELLRRQLLELQQRESGGMSLLPGQQYPRSTAEAEARMNHQLMQMQRERFQQVQKEQNEMDQQQKEVASKKVNDTQPVELDAAKGDAVKEEEDKAPDTNEDDKKEGAKVSPMVKDLIARYKDKKDVEI
mmetsp:Transcript_26202/g.39062  ORF Transcript_26202/g.39062 Transcript_26202/m.39062 type:complete len:415 (+) Transcript_26202:105-1349(+)